MRTAFRTDRRNGSLYRALSWGQPLGLIVETVRSIITTAFRTDCWNSSLYRALSWGQPLGLIVGTLCRTLSWGQPSGLIVATVLSVALDHKDSLQDLLSGHFSLSRSIMKTAFRTSCQNTSLCRALSWGQPLRLIVETLLSIANRTDMILTQLSHKQQSCPLGLLWLFIQKPIYTNDALQEISLIRSIFCESDRYRQHLCHPC